MSRFALLFVLLGACYRDDDPNLPPPCSVFEPPCFEAPKDAGAQ